MDILWKARKGKKMAVHLFQNISLKFYSLLSKSFTTFDTVTTFLHNNQRVAWDSQTPCSNIKVLMSAPVTMTPWADVSWMLEWSEELICQLIRWWEGMLDWTDVPKHVVRVCLAEVLICKFLDFYFMPNFDGMLKEAGPCGPCSSTPCLSGWHLSWLQLKKESFQAW